MGRTAQISGRRGRHEPFDASMIDALRDRYLPVLGRTFAPAVARLDQQARSDTLLLLRGPTGAGKTRLARWCWNRSPRQNAPFVVADLHCSSDGLRASDLFGHRQGAFTGALGRRPGLLREADGGTLFLDEIDKLDLESQAMLLHVLEEGEYRELGGIGRSQVSVRFIVGTNADLQEAMHQGRFREDLYYRIQVLPTMVLPLAQRSDEIGPWAEHMLVTLHMRRFGNDRVSLSEDATAALVAYPWPGNLRQLSNVVQRAWQIALHEGETDPVCVEAEDVFESLDQEAPLNPRAGTAALEEAASVIVEQAIQRKGARAETMDIGLMSGFTGLVLATAVHRVGSIREAFELFGLQRQFAGGNHLQTFRRELSHAHELYRQLDAETPAWLGPSGQSSS